MALLKKSPEILDASRLTASELDAEATALVRVMDAGGDGKVDFAEFERAMDSRFATARVERYCRPH